jgi:hypothetical protein
MIPVDWVEEWQEPYRSIGLLIQMAGGETTGSKGQQPRRDTARATDVVRRPGNGRLRPVSRTERKALPYSATAVSLGMVKRNSAPPCG